jgi:peptidoglycan/LPS O-acetylase OafA/YrhL
LPSAVPAHVSVEGGASAYRPAIDGLRAIAVIPVVLYHLSPRLVPGGFVGVDIFFVISGYLITGILLRDLRSGRFSVARFYRRRISRLFPALMVMLACTMVACAFIYQGEDLATAARSLEFTILSLANFRYMVNGHAYFQMQSDAQPLLHCWSLAVEEQFYLFFPVIFYAVYRLWKKHIVAIFGVAGVLSFALCIVLTRHNPNWAFYLLPTRAWELLAGGVLAQAGLSRSSLSPSLRRYLPSVGLLLICLSFAIVKEHGFPVFIAALPVAGSVCVLGFSADIREPAEKLLAAPPLVWIGQVSYSLYIWHWPIFSLIDYRYFAATEWFRVLLKVLLTAAATVASYYCVERPARIYLNQASKPTAAFAFAALAVAVTLPAAWLMRRTASTDGKLSYIKSGGLVYNANGAHNGTVMVIGDSHGSMWGPAVRDVAEAKNMRFISASASGQMVQPTLQGSQSEAWIDTVRLVRRVHPTYLIYVCAWEDKLKGRSGTLALALQTLKPLAGNVILITEPPFLPEDASREDFRNGVRPPFFEPQRATQLRAVGNATVESAAGPGVTVLDVKGLYTRSNGSVMFLDDGGRQLYFDSTHLSDLGARRIEPLLTEALR